MSDVVDQHHDFSADEPKVPEMLAGYVAEFSGPKALMQAAEKTRDAGFKVFDCYVPFPLHGLDDAMGVQRTRLPFIVLGCAFAGLITAVVMQVYTNAIDYPFITSGKPFLSIPSMMPVTFELTILFSAFGALFGMLALNKLPQFYNRLFRLNPFQKVTSDGFFLAIEVDDPKFHETSTRQFLESLGATSVIECRESREKVRLPKVVSSIMILLMVVGLIPLVLAARMRYMPSDVPRIELLHDMDFQPKLKTQRASRMFSDNRGMRPVIPGTLARGDYSDNPEYTEGLLADQADSIERALLLPNAKNPDGTSVSLNEFPWVSEFPVEVDAALMQRGKERYDIYCALCHGMTGVGDGLVTQRAMELQQAAPTAGTWITPVSLYSDAIKQQRVGQLFNTITHGVRKMPGYEAQIPVKDRWAIVLYLRALQEAGSGNLEAVPAEERESLSAQAE